MSSDTKEPLETQDTSTESDESHSEKELEKTEGNMEHLKIEATKDDFDESKAADSPKQEGTPSRADLFNEIYAEQGLQKPHLEGTRGSSDPECKVACLTDPSKEKEIESRGIDENIGAKMEEDPHETSEKDVEPTTSQNFPSRIEEGESPETSKKGAEATAHESLEGAEEGDYDTTSSTSPYSQFPEGVAPAQEMSSVTASNILLAGFNFAVPRVIPPPPPAADSLSAPLLGSAGQFASSISLDSVTDNENTSADVSEIHSEIADDYREENFRPDAAPGIVENKESPSHSPAVARQSPYNSDTDISELQDDFAPPPANSGAFGMPEPMEDKPDLADQVRQVFERLERERRNVDSVEELNVHEDARKRTAVSRLLVQTSSRVCDVEEGSPSKRKRPLQEVGDSSMAEGGIPDISKTPVLQSISEYPEPKSSSPYKLPRKQLPESQSLQSTSIAEKGKRLGPLPSMQHSTVSSKDSVIAVKEEDQASALRGQDLRLMETKVDMPVQMETTVVKGDEEATKSTELSGAKASTSRDPAYGSEVEGTPMEHEHIDDLEYEVSVGRSKRDRKLKKGRSGKMPKPRTRPDSRDPVGPSVVDCNLQHSESTSSRDESDSTLPESQEETQL